MNKTILTVVLSIFVISMFSLVVAEGKNDTDKEARQVLRAEANMTYGNCVSEAAVLKNTCYSTTKTTKETCKIVAQNETESKTATKKCNDNYKKEMKQCKTGFKSEKNECKKIKHNFFENAKVAFK